MVDAESLSGSLSLSNYIIVLRNRDFQHPQIHCMNSMAVEIFNLANQTVQYAPQDFQ